MAKLTATNANNNEFFGTSVDVDGDTIVARASGDDTDSDPNAVVSDVGSAYVFVNESEGWTQAAELTAEDADATNRFGYSVALDGGTIVAGAWSDNRGGNTDVGSAYVFIRPTACRATATETVKLTDPDGAALDQFGRPVAVTGDTIVAGANRDDHGDITDPGSAYVFSDVVA
ncbi:MAG: FG-GAP repeat protein [Actinomycetia bacterium]|nr:FG-GAP repeat protein [Actinomycetes bacterium]